MQIGTRHVGSDHPPYVIAEIGVNHDGSEETARRLIDGAAAAGVDGVKFQCFEPELLLSRAAGLAKYQRRAGEAAPDEMLGRLRLPLEAMGRLVDRAHECGLHAIVTVFSAELVPATDQLPWDAYKTASPDLVNKPLLEALGETGKPLIVSTGASTIDEVCESLGWLEAQRARLALLHCVSCYPTPTEQSSLGGIVALRRVFDGPIGYSDHTMDTDTGELAVRLHASILEKHITHDQEAQGPDHGASLECEQMAWYTARARQAWADLSHPCSVLSEYECRRIGPLEKRVLDIERDVRRASRQSLVTRRTLEAGDVITPADLTVKRPGSGIEPAKLARVIGRTVARHVDADMPLTWNDLGGTEGALHQTTAA